MNPIGKFFVTAFALATALQPPLQADPCGMVPPIYMGSGPPLVRVGTQQTYVFYKDGMETLVLRPGFEGKVEEFGMLIPFPSPPAIRKVADDVFGHVAAAIDPPEVVVDLRYSRFEVGRAMRSLSSVEESAQDLAVVREDQVRVLREEAVGMYQVAVLEAGSSSALQGWMDEHGFRYPEGMDAICGEYVQEGWCFVAVKATVGSASSSLPQPGQRELDVALPAGAGFDGHVQAMGFRFQSEELVVPMRLSAFNEGPLHNVVYLLAEGGRRINGIDEKAVVRQVSGSELLRNLTLPLPLRVLGGAIDDIPLDRRASLPTERDPIPHNGIARELFASDLLAAQLDTLALSFEEREKEFLAIDEALGLRGPEIDLLRHAALSAERESLIEGALGDLLGMTLTVIDGEFPRQLLAESNLHFDAFAMASEANSAKTYDAKLQGPSKNLGGVLLRESDLHFAPPLMHFLLSNRLLLGFGLLCLAALILLFRARRRLSRVAVSMGTIVLAGAALVPSARAQQESDLRYLCVRGQSTPQGQVDGLIHDAKAAPRLEARGQAIVALLAYPQDRVRAEMRSLRDNDSDALIRAWAGAACIALVDSGPDLCALTMVQRNDAVYTRPLGMRWQALLASDIELSLGDALESLSGNGKLASQVMPMLLERDPTQFVDLLTSSPSQGVRRQAASALATIGLNKEGVVARLVLDAYRFDPAAESVPWEKGPLFLPGLAWTRGQARQLASDLLQWMLWADCRADTTAKQQIVNNLVSIGLARTAGFAPPGRTTDVVPWLVSWANCAGSGDVARMLAVQGLENEKRFQSLLAAR